MSKSNESNKPMPNIELNSMCRIATIALSLISVSLVESAFGAAEDAKPADQPTYSKHVATILWKNCAGCHCAGEVGPFPLLTFKDAEKRADMIADVVARRQMPPWKPEPNFGAFHGVRRLSDDDLKTVVDWAAAGAPEGNASDLPEPPKFTEGWRLGEPDLILKMPAEFEIPAEGRDIYRCFVLPFGNADARTVAAAEFRPGNRRVVHHAVFYLDNTGEARQKDQDEAGPGYNSFGGPGFIPTGGLGGWAPGYEPQFLPDGLGAYVRPETDFVLQVHYHPSGKPERDQSQVGIYFTRKPVERLVTGIALLNPRLNIPPGAKRHEVRAEATIPVDVTVTGVAPHMHLLGREIKFTATKPDGVVVPLVWVKDWDFNWQDQYRFAETFRLPKGTHLEVVAYYDNSTDNPANPNNPPRRVRWGEETTDEMCICSLQVYTDTLSDVRELQKMPHGIIGSALGGGSLPETFSERAMRFFLKLQRAREKSHGG